MLSLLIIVNNINIIIAFMIVSTNKLQAVLCGIGYSQYFLPVKSVKLCRPTVALQPRTKGILEGSEYNTSRAIFRRVQDAIRTPNLRPTAQPTEHNTSSKPIFCE